MRGRRMKDKNSFPRKAFSFTKQFQESYASLPKDIIKLFEKKIRIFLENIFHPSFRTKKIQVSRKINIWEASLTMDFRFTFQIEKDGTIIFRNIGKHSIIYKRNY
jgi:mRNA-degrading endonuclease RelE of RelBE toxin-antitoxin system